MEQYAAEWQEWHDARLADLAKPFGWLSVTGLIWLDEAVPAAWEDTPGSFVLDGEWVHFDLAPQASAGPATAALDLLSHPRTDAEVRVVPGERLSARVGRDGSLSWIVADHQLFELLDRDGRAAIRRRDSKAPLLSRFVDVPTYEVDRRWAVGAQFERFDPPRAARIATAAPGLEMDEELTGEIRFELAGAPYRLLASGSPEAGLSVTFHDYTNGEGTEAWRRLSVGVPDAQGRVVLDFNRAVNYPMAFTPYATCPAPVAENFLPLEVTAGERRPTQTLSEGGVNTPLLLIDTGGDAQLEPFVAEWAGLGLDVTRADWHAGAPLPPLAGFEAVVVLGFDPERLAQAAPERAAALLECLSDAIGAGLPVVAAGTATRVLVSAVAEVAGSDAPSMVAGQVPTSAVSLAVSADVAEDALFRSLIGAPGEDGVGFIAVDELVEAAPDESRSAALLRTWLELAERFARLVHLRAGGVSRP